VTGWKRKNQN